MAFQEAIRTASAIAQALSGKVDLQTPSQPDIGNSPVAIVFEIKKNPYDGSCLPGVPGYLTEEYYVVDYKSDEGNLGKVRYGGRGTEVAGPVKVVDSDSHGYITNYMNLVKQLVVHVCFDRTYGTGGHSKRDLSGKNIPTLRRADVILNYRQKGHTRR